MNGFPQQQLSTQPTRKRRVGATHLEMVTACVLLGATLVSISTFRQRTIGSTAAVQRTSFAQSKLLNLRREISTWPYDDVTAAAIEKHPADETNFLPQVRWIVDVKEVDQPIAGKQVVLALQWQVNSLPQTCPRLTFWVKRP